MGNPSSARRRYDIVIRGRLSYRFESAFDDVTLMTCNGRTTLRADLDVSLGELTLQLEALLRHIEPCGVGNPSPVLVARNVTVAGPPRVVGKEHEHLKLWPLPGRGAGTVNQQIDHRGPVKSRPSQLFEWRCP